MSGRWLCFSFILSFSLLLVYPVLSIPEQGLFERALQIPNTNEPQKGAIVDNFMRSMSKDSYFTVKITNVSCPSDVTSFTVELNVVSINCWNTRLDEGSEFPEKSSVASHKEDFFCYNNNTYPGYMRCNECRWNANHTVGSNKTKSIPKDAAVVIYEDGIYVLVLSVTINGAPADSEKKLAGVGSLDATIEARSSYGYLSAADWPQLPFFRVMFVVYFFYMFIWLVLCCCHRADLLRIQYWVGGVILIGLIEKAVFLGEYETLNKTGRSVYGAIIFGELVSSAKKMISRMLIIVVSVGFGIVKPRLGTTLHKVLAVGLVYFIASATEGCLRAIRERMDRDRMMTIAELVLAIIDSCICWWIFSALIQTMRTLRLRRNLVKLSLYRHFTNTLIFAVLASVGFMIWSIIEHKFAECIQDWKELWVDEAFWHLLFAILLLVIMVLWRPSANNQRYAYSPLTDAADDEAEEPMINEAFDGIKMRNTKSQENNSKKSESQMDDDLKWIEENIPASVVESALPGILDSEEEVLTTAYEMNKMQ